MRIVHNTKCRMCKGTNFEMVIDFGESPLVNSLLEKDELGTEKTLPLVVRQCQDCFLVQITDIADAHDIYKGQDYLYFSSDMPELDKYFKAFADDVKQYVKKDDFILEIGSNDGIWLENFDNPKLGVDPALNVVIRALKKGIPTLPDFFSEKLAKMIKKEYGRAKVIMGANCIAHLNDLNDLMKGIQRLLKKDGVFIVECNYWGNMVKNGNYALIYHDHFSYFSLRNWFDYVPKFGLHVFDAVITPAQGGSLRVFMGNKPITERCKKILRDEETSNLHSLETAKKYRAKVKEKAEKLNKLVKPYMQEGRAVAGYGAAAKGFSVLQMAGINYLDFFVDDSPAKQNKYTPITHTKVFARDDVEDPDVFLITAPNYKDIIVKKEQKFLENGGIFITVDCEVIDGIYKS